MLIWTPFLIATLVLLLADAVGAIDLHTRPLGRILKWLLMAGWAWVLPFFVKHLCNYEPNPQLWTLWKLLILGVLAGALIKTVWQWIRRSYGPVAEGHRRCPVCRTPVLKVMMECPSCKKPLPEST